MDLERAYFYAKKYIDKCMLCCTSLNLEASTYFGGTAVE